MTAKTHFEILRKRMKKCTKTHGKVYKKKHRFKTRRQTKSSAKTIAKEYHSFTDRPITITHFSKVQLSCKNMCAIVIVCSNSKLSPFSFMLGYMCWLRHTAHGNIAYAVCCTFFSTSTNMYTACWDLSHRIQHSDDYDKLLLVL